MKQNVHEPYGRPASGANNNNAARFEQIIVLLTPALSMNLVADKNPANPPGTGAFAIAQGSFSTSDQ